MAATKAAEDGIYMPTAPIYADEESITTATTSKRLYLMRNGEPCDRLSPGWRTRALPDHHTYRMVDINQPGKVVRRPSPADKFRNDAPLTQLGALSAQLIGRGLSERSLDVHCIFSSPALRCVETAKAVVGAIAQRRKPRICIEPGLFEPLHFYWQDKCPNFLSPSDLARHEFPVDVDYVPVYTVEKLSEMLFTEKTPDDTYSRVGHVANTVTEAVKERSGGGGVLVVCHPPTIDALTRGVLGIKEKPTTWEDVHTLGESYPYGSVTTLELSPPNSADTRWLLNPEALPPITYMHMSTASRVPNIRG